jgi:hypothetical protein
MNRKSPSGGQPYTRVDLEPRVERQAKKSRRVGLDFECSAYFATASERHVGEHDSHLVVGFQPLFIGADGLVMIVPTFSAVVGHGGTSQAPHRVHCCTTAVGQGPCQSCLPQFRL